MAPYRVRMTKTAERRANKGASKKTASSHGNGSAVRARGGKEKPATVSGTLTLLADIRGRFAALTEQETAEFMSQHTADALSLIHI